MPISRLALVIPIVFLSLLISCTSSDQPQSASPKTASAHAEKTTGSDAKRHTIRVRAESLPFLTIEPVQSRLSAQPVEAPGRVEFRQQAVSAVGTPVAGRVASIRVQPGDRVRAGEVLLVLHSPEAAGMRAALATARAGLKLAEETARRQAQMLARGVGLELEKLEADRRLSEARAEFDRASRTARLLGENGGAQVAIKAPIPGTVVKLNTTQGSAVEPGGASLVELGDAGSLWIVAEVFERDLPGLNEGDEASVDLAVTPGRPIRGKVAALGAVFADEQRRVPAYIILEEASAGLRPGMYARVSIQPGGDETVLLPTSAVLVKDRQHTIVYVETGPGQFAQRTVMVGIPSDGRVPVLGGLKPGERVVVRGALLLDGEAEQLL